jgi:hypothetical protein
MAARGIVRRWRDRRARELYQRYGARPWDLIDERTRDHYRQLVAAGIDGAGRPLTQGRVRIRETRAASADY